VLRTAREEGVDTPVVVLTGRDDAETVAELMKAGATDYLNKSSATPERLEQAMRHAVRLGEAEYQARVAEQALRESEARFRILHETSPDGFMILHSVRNEAGEIEDFAWDYVNPSAERLVGHPAEELRGRRLLEVFPGNRDEGLFDLYLEVVETGEPRQTEVRYSHEHLDLWLRVTAAQLGDGFAVSFTDISLRKRAEEERERALTARSRFYAAMSHELRTPMNAILGYTDLLLAGAYGELTEPQLHGIQRTHRAAQHLLELVNDVLDLSKLEAGKLEVSVEPTDLPLLVRDLLATVQPMAEERGVELVFHDDGCGAPVATDPRRVRQILLNLLSNAIKFGRGKPVEVRCARADPNAATLEVSDRGGGIPAEDLPRIFEEFVQLERDEQPGTGLGLPISRRLAELLGGSLEVESRVGEGSVFRLVIPAAPGPVRATPTPAE
jgi:PAS domain S-box-containing protein